MFRVTSKIIGELLTQANGMLREDSVDYLLIRYGTYIGKKLWGQSGHSQFSPGMTQREMYYWLRGFISGLKR